MCTVKYLNIGVVDPFKLPRGREGKLEEAFVIDDRRYVAESFLRMYMHHVGCLSDP